MAEKTIIVLVHGWSVRSTETYGELPARLEAEAEAGRAPAVDIRHIWLSKYVSFRDEVRLVDLARGFEAALRDQLAGPLNRGRRFACITHSTGGPVVRDWWDRYYSRPQIDCPMSHLIMLAPANFGSALAQLGKSRLSRIKTWFQGVEPGQGVLDWLEFGSAEACELNTRWIREYGDPTVGDAPVYPFVLTGQTIDRKLYDHVNAYTGELGSDGVVRAAAANLNAAYVRMDQQEPVHLGGEEYEAPKLVLKAAAVAPPTAFVLLRGRSHSGEDKGILRSIRREGGSHMTVTAILKCLKVQSQADYAKVRIGFEKSNAVIRDAERVERIPKFFRDQFYIHDASSMLILRIRDDYEHTVDDFDFKFTGKRGDPDALPPGFFKDRQRNLHQRGTITYFLNHDVLMGAPEIRKPGAPRVILRPEQAGVQTLGLEISPQPTDGYVHYLDATLRAQKRNLAKFLKPDQTTIIDIVLRRIVHEGVFRLTKVRRRQDFIEQPRGPKVE